MPRAIEYLVSLYPEKTGLEITEIYNQEVKEEEQKFQEDNKKTLETIKDYNENGAYFKGRFGCNQYYMYNCYNFEMDGKGRVRMDVDKIVMFNGDDKDDRVFIELRIKEYEDASNYSLGRENRITKEEWDKAIKYLDGFRPNFWEKIDLNK